MLRAHERVQLPNHGPMLLTTLLAPSFLLLTNCYLILATYLLLFTSYFTLLTFSLLALRFLLTLLTLRFLLLAQSQITHAPKSCTPPYFRRAAPQITHAPPTPPVHPLLAPTHPPTPTTFAGPSFNPLNIGAQEQWAIERRDDVLVFTSDPLPSRLLLAGHVSLRLHAASSSPSIDLVGRLCVVTGPIGSSILPRALSARIPTRSTNLCEGLLRVDAASGEETVGGEEGMECIVDLGPVAAEFPAKSRIRLQVCAAAHPRWMRNLCAKPQVPLAQQTCGAPATVCIWPSSSVLVLPIIPSS